MIIYITLELHYSFCTFNVFRQTTPNLSSGESGKFSLVYINCFQVDYYSYEWVIHQQTLLWLGIYTGQNSY